MPKFNLICSESRNFSAKRRLPKPTHFLPFFLDFLNFSYHFEYSSYQIRTKLEFGIK